METLRLFLLCFAIILAFIFFAASLILFMMFLEKKFDKIKTNINNDNNGVKFIAPELKYFIVKRDTEKRFGCLYTVYLNFKKELNPLKI